jgi:hypothetical protein
MTKIYAALLLIILSSCQGNSKSVRADSVHGKSHLDTGTITLGKIPSDAIVDTSTGRDNTPTQEEEKKRISETYNDVNRIDSVIINGSDTLKFHLKYYCLKGNLLIVPKSFDERESIKEEFKTHPFVSSIVLIRNKDTVLNRKFRASDFIPFFKAPFDNIKKYGSISMPVIAENKTSNGLLSLLYTVGIPSTDLGAGIFLTIKKNGEFLISEHY